VLAEFDLYVRGRSWLHRLDPRVKLAFVVEATLLTFLWPSIVTSVGLALVCGVLMWRAGISLGQIGRVARTLAPLAGMIFLLTALFGRPEDAPLAQWGPLAVTRPSVVAGVTLAARLLALALIVLMWLFTTDQAAMVRGFLALGMPYHWGLTLALALRYLPIFGRLLEQVREAQQARGLDLQQRGLLARVQSYRPVLVAMIIAALRNAERLGWALEARAVGASGVQRTTLRPLRFRRADWLALAGLFVLALVAVLLRIS
jgi:energy-coupling factor transport system permease protein